MLHRKLLENTIEPVKDLNQSPPGAHVLGFTHFLGTTSLRGF
jgi:hypothetical protein